jgi:hypothetical protein
VTVSVEAQAGFIVQGASREYVDAAADKVMQYLLDVESSTTTHSAAVSTDLGKSSVEIELVASGEDYDAATMEARDVIKAAIEHAGGEAKLDNPAWLTTSQRFDLVPA